MPSVEEIIYGQFEQPKPKKYKVYQSPRFYWPGLEHLRMEFPHIYKRMIRDVKNTSGGRKARFNRVMAHEVSFEEMELYGKDDVTKWKPEAQQKLREGAASYEDCVAVADKLTFDIYQMVNAPKIPLYIQEYLTSKGFGEVIPNSGRCSVCNRSIDFNLFNKSRAGYSEINLAHDIPRVHKAENVGFAHQRCNLFQGNLTKDKMMDEAKNILEGNGFTVISPQGNLTKDKMIDEAKNILERNGFTVIRPPEIE